MVKANEGGAESEEALLSLQDQDSSHTLQVRNLRWGTTNCALKQFQPTITTTHPYVVHALKSSSSGISSYVSDLWGWMMSE